MAQIIRQCGVTLLTCIVITWTGFSSFNSIIWVDDDDPTCGGQSPCYQTIQEALAAAQPGDTIKIRPGTYQGPIIISQDLTISGESPEHVFIQENPTAEWRQGTISITGFAKVTIENITLRGTAYGILALEAHVTLSRIHFYGHLVAVQLSGGRLTLLNSQFSQHELGIFLASGVALLSRIEGNHFEGSTAAIKVDGKSIVIIQDNKIIGSSRGGILPNVGIEVGGFAEAFIHANTIQNTQTGIWVRQSAKAHLESNHVMDNQRDGVMISDQAQATVVRNQILRNGFSGGFGVVVSDAATVEVVENHLEGNLLGLGATQALDPSAKQIPKLDAYKNSIMGNGWGVLVLGAAATLRNNDITRNESNALAMDPSFILLLELIYPTSGVLIRGGESLLEANRITQNRKGIVLQGLASPTLRENQIMNNTEYGIALYRRPCFERISMLEWVFQGKVLGEANELSGNAKGDLCPPDYPWPPGFRR